MKTLKYLSTALIFAVTACNTDYVSDNYSSSDLEPMSFSELQTRTILNPTDGSVNWTAGDQIAIFDNLNGKNIFSNSAEDVSSFYGNVTLGTTHFWGVYPYSLVESASNGIVSATLPSTQNPKAGTFAENLNFSVASGSKTPGTPQVTGVTFQNVCGLISFTVPSRIAAKKVTFTSSSRAIAGTLAIDCENATATISSNGSKAVTMEGDFAAGSTFYFVVTPGKIEGFKIEVETKAGSEYYKSASNGVIDVTAGQITNLKDIDFKNGIASASASHTYSNNTLTGTSLTVQHGIPSDMWADVTNLSITVSKDGKNYRSYSSTSITGAEVVPTGKIYLPQGTYTVSGHYTTNGIQTPVSTTFSVGAPSGIKVVSVDGTTSYKLYEDGNTTSANGHDGKTISSPSVKLSGVSAEVLKECPASVSFSANNKTVSGTASSIEFAAGNLTGLSVGSHTLNCSVNFDGTTANGSTTCIITGLPYSFNFYKNKDNFGNEGWTINGSTGWQSDLLWLSGLDGLSRKSGWVATPAMYAPEKVTITTTVNLNTKFYEAKTGIFSKFSEMTFYLGVTSSPTTSNNTVSGKSAGGNSTSSDKEIRSFSTNGLSIPTGTHYISINHNNTTSTGSHFYLSSYSCLYR